MPSNSSKMINSALPQVQPQLSAGLDLQLFNTTPHVCIEIDARWLRFFVYRIIYIITFVEQLYYVNIQKRSRYSIRIRKKKFFEANFITIFRCKLGKQIATCMVVEHRYNRPSSTLITSEKTKQN